MPRWQNSRWMLGGRRDWWRAPPAQEEAEAEQGDSFGPSTSLGRQEIDKLEEDGGLAEIMRASKKRQKCAPSCRPFLSQAATAGARASKLSEFVMTALLLSSQSTAARVCVRGRLLSCCKRYVTGQYCCTSACTVEVFVRWLSARHGIKCSAGLASSGGSTPACLRAQ